MAIMGNVTRLTADQCEALGQLGASLYLELLSLAETTSSAPAAPVLRPAQQPHAVPVVPTVLPAHAGPRLPLSGRLPVVQPLLYRPAFAPESPLPVAVVPQYADTGSLEEKVVHFLPPG